VRREIILGGGRPKGGVGENFPSFETAPGRGLPQGDSRIKGRSSVSKKKCSVPTSVHQKVNQGMKKKRWQTIEESKS